MNSMVEVIVGGWPAAQSSGHHGCILIGTHIFVAYKRLSTVCPQLQYRNWLIDVSSTPPTVTVVRPWISFIWRQCLSSVTPKTKHTIVNNSINVVVVIWTEHSRGCDRRFFINVCVCVWHLFIRTNETNWQTQVAGQQPQKAAEQRRNGSVKVNQCHSNKFPLCLMELPLMRCESAQCMTNSYTKVSYIVEYRIIICGLSAMTSETPLFSMKAFLAAQYWISMVGNVMRQQKKKINTLHIIQI